MRGSQRRPDRVQDDPAGATRGIPPMRIRIAAAALAVVAAPLYLGAFIGF